MKYLLIFIITFLLVYLLYYFVVVRREKGLEAFKKGKQVLFFKNAYNLNLEKLNYEKFANSLAVTNAFIIAFVVAVLEIFDNLIIKLLVGFVTLIPLILICYYVLGKIYKNKEAK